MNAREMHDIMTYIFADFDLAITSEKRAVWLDQFKHYDYKIGMLAARLLLGRKTFGPPKASDFLEAIKEVTATDAERQTWGEAWDLWIEIARRHGYYNAAAAFELYKRKCELGGSALGTSYKDWFSLKTDDVPTFRAQFRQRFEALQKRADLDRTMPPDLKFALEAERERFKLVLPQK